MPLGFQLVFQVSIQRLCRFELYNKPPPLKKRIGFNTTLVSVRVVSFVSDPSGYFSFNTTLVSVRDPDIKFWKSVFDVSIQRLCRFEPLSGKDVMAVQQSFNTTLVSVRVVNDMFTQQSLIKFQYNACVGSSPRILEISLFQSSFNTTLVSVRATM